jgi:peptidyl-prolyl cis-trans isomerase A (cyclophilin A)
MHQTQPSLFGKLMTMFAGFALSGAVLAAPVAAPSATPQVEIKTSSTA